MCVWMGVSGCVDVCVCVCRWVCLGVWMCVCVICVWVCVSLLVAHVPSVSAETELKIIAKNVMNYFYIINTILFVNLNVKK